MLVGTNQRQLHLVDNWLLWCLPATMLQTSDYLHHFLNGISQTSHFFSFLLPTPHITALQLKIFVYLIINQTFVGLWKFWSGWRIEWMCEKGKQQPGQWLNIIMFAESWMCWTVTSSGGSSSIQWLFQELQLETLNIAIACFTESL